MRQVALIVGFSALACLMGGYPSTSGALSSALDYETADQSLIVKIKKDKDKSKEKSKPFNCKKAKCDPGETKLDKPNIYGACCQVGAEPLKHKTAPAEKEKCKFPGEVGEPPNCSCPKGTEFMGNKGCVVPKMYTCKAYQGSKSLGSITGSYENAKRAAEGFRSIGSQLPPDKVVCTPE